MRTGFPPPNTSCRAAAIQLLSRRDHGQHELSQKLASKGYLPQEIDQAVQFCFEHGYLDDLRYAKSQIRQHVSKGHGERRIRQELLFKQVADSVINRAFAEEPQDWFELAKMVAMKKFNGVKAKEQKEYAKQIRFLQYRGFSFEQVDYAFSQEA